VRDLTRLKHASDLDFVSLGQKVPGAVDVGLQVVIRNTRTNLYTLYFLLRFLFVFSELGFQVFVLAMINDLANGWLSVRRDHHQVKALFAGERERSTALHHT